MLVLVSLKGGSGLLDSISSVGIGGQLVVEGVLEGGECRLRSPQTLLSDGHLYSNLLRLAVHDNCHVMLILSGDDLGVSGGGVQLSASTAAPQT